MKYDFAKSVVYNFDTVTSTNDFARELITNHKIVIITALFQTEGKGRNTNHWYGSYGNNIYLSIGIRHNEVLTAEEIASFQAIGALSVKYALSKYCPNKTFKIKYPNDIYVQDGKFKKISGILVEHGFAGSFCSYSIVGIGVNVNEQIFHPDIIDNVTSLLKIDCQSDINKFQEIVLNEFSKIINLETQEIFTLWVDELDIIGKSIEVLNDNFTYIANKVLIDGRLELINTLNNEKKIIDNGDSIRYNFS
jgi:BirA family biotin operon repressor/biotin-[acetyl-CoA-carboxylase] ligase